MPVSKLTNEIVLAAIGGFEAQKLQIDTQIAELRAMLGGDRVEPAAAPEVPTTKRKKRSAAARKRMAEAQRKRWARSKGSSAAPAPPVVAKNTSRKKAVL